LLSVYGIHCKRHPDLGDIYGFAQSIRALVKVRLSHPTAGLVILTPGNSDKPYFKELQALARQSGVQNAILWETESMPDASPLWKFSDIYLRPTTTDGDAVSVREALSLGTPVVASDAAERPEGCQIFPSQNAAAFAEAINETLKNTSGKRIPLVFDGYAAIRRIYSEIGEV